MASHPARSVDSRAVVAPPRVLQAAGAIGVGVNSLLVVGLFPALLGALAYENRLSARDIGLTATIELLAMGAATALAGAAMRPERLKLVAVFASLALAALDLATAGAGGPSLMALRAGAGAAEGTLLWITIGMIARTETPERWAGVLFTAQTSCQLALALAFALFVIPRYGAAGGYSALALFSLAGVLPALATASRYAPLPSRAAPPARGWIALFATLCFVAAAGAVAVYLQPLALQAGLTPGVARTAVWVSLAAQVAGGASATALAGRIGYVRVFAAGAVLLSAVWFSYAFRIPAPAFVAANALAGLVIVFIAPFYVPMLIEADPTRSAAVQSGGAQLLGGALGPLLASRIVSEHDVHGVLVLASASAFAGLGAILWLRMSAKPDGPWSEEFAETATADLNADDTITLHNVRDWTYADRAILSKDWRDVTVDPASITGAAFFIEPFGSWKAVGHTLVSFEFKDAAALTFSIEAKRRTGQAYSAIRGAFRTFLLAYQWGTERDFVTRRLLLLSHPLRMYPLAIPPQTARALFLDLVEETNGLARRPRYYNTLTENCTNALAQIVNRHAPRTLPLGLSWYLPGYSDEYLMRHGFIVRDGGSMERTKAIHDLAPHRSAIEAIATVDPGAFSARLRALSRAAASPDATGAPSRQSEVAG